MNEIEFLNFEDWKGKIVRNKLKDSWIIVYEFHYGDNKYATFCSLVPNKKEYIGQILKNNTSWEVNRNFGYPSWVMDSNGNIYYERFESIGSIPFEPLVIYRSFNGPKEDYIEISEEFRLYHNLYHDTTKNEYISILDNGEEESVIKLEKLGDGFRVEIKTKYLRDFLAAKSMALVRFHEHYRRISKNNITNIFNFIKLEKLHHDSSAKIEKYSSDKITFGLDHITLDKIEKTFCFRLDIINLNGWTSRFTAKDIILPFNEPKHKDYKFLKGEDDKEEYAEYIIGINEEGEDIKHTCNPNKLKDYKRKPDAPSYFTPVFFKREVLKKYHETPSKYEVYHNYVVCKGFWSISYGKNKLGFIHVWLGDLGRLPSNEQFHWKQYNIPPEGGVDPSTIKRELYAEFVEPDDIICRFKHEFETFKNIWKYRFGWDLFLSLMDEDIHYYESLHVPTSEELLEFENQILAMAKILPDSINQYSLKQLLINNDDLKGGINILEKFLILYFKIREEEAKEIVRPLRNIQDIRSKAVAHRKGKGYKKVYNKTGLIEGNYINSFEKILEEAIIMLKKIEDICNN